MPKATVFLAGRTMAWLAAIVTLGLCAACGPIKSGAPANAQLAGHWVLDAAASDVVTVKIEQAVSAADAKWVKRHPPGSYGGPGFGPGVDAGRAGGGTGSDDDYGTPMLLAPDWNQLRMRLMLSLKSPQSLVFEVQSDFVRLRADDIPPLDYHPDEVFSRIDEYGTATIDSGWSANAFVLRLRYSGGATRLERYELDAHTDTLHVTRSLNDSQAGKLEIHSLYRRG